VVLSYVAVLLNIDAHEGTIWQQMIHTRGR